MNYSVETIPNFDKEFKKLAKKYPSLKKEVIELGNLLTEEPTKGTAIGKNCYKIRLSIKSKGKGKSGGARAITCVVAVDERVLLLSIYDKSEQANIPDKLLDQLLTDAGL